MAETSEWISVGALGEAFAPDANLLAQTELLSGRTISLHLEDGSISRLQFLNASQMRWQGDQVSYRATEIRSGIVLLSVARPDKPASSIAVVLDLPRGICTALLGQLPSKSEAMEPLLTRITRGSELTGVRATFLSGAIDAPWEAASPRHAKTRELIGRRIEYTYSLTEKYEHLYLNEQLYTWHCLSGSEKGLADTDRCEYRKIAEDLYLFVWREKLVPTLGIVLVDLAQLKTTGQILGYQGFDFAAVTSFPVGARARVMRNP